MNKLTKAEIALSESVLTEQQMSFIMRRTPKAAIKSRPGKGGQKWAYVTGTHVRKCLNALFGFDWDFEIIDAQKIGDEAIVKGRLTCRTAGRTIVKMQFGCKDVMYKKGTDTPLSIGNDFKAAATDALKKCAAELGIAADVYHADEFREVEVVTDEVRIEELSQLLDLKREAMTEDQVNDANRIIEGREVANYQKLFNLLKSI